MSSFWKNLEVEDERSQGKRSNSRCTPGGFGETNHHVMEGPSDREWAATSNCWGPQSPKHKGLNSTNNTWAWKKVLSPRWDCSPSKYWAWTSSGETLSRGPSSPVSRLRPHGNCEIIHLWWLIIQCKTNIIAGIYLSLCMCQTLCNGYYIDNFI